MRTDIWYPLVCFAALAFFVQIVAGALSIPGRGIQGWFTWAMSVFAAGLMLVAGYYAAAGTWIEDLFNGFIGLSPVIRLVVGVAILALIGYLILGVIPDAYSGVGLSSALVVGAFFLPLWVQHGMPPGKVADQAADLVRVSGAFAREHTAGWFS